MKRRRVSQPVLTDHPAEHRLLLNAKPHFEKVYPLSTWSVEYPRPYKKLIPDIVASLEGLGRALEAANVLFQAMERHGYQVVLAPSDTYYHRPALEHREQPRRPLGPYERDSWCPSRPTVAMVGTVAIGLTVYEISEYVEVERVDDRYVRKDTLPPRKRREAWRSDWVHKEDLPSGRLGLRAYSPYPGAPWQKEWREKTPGELPGQAGAIIRGLAKAAPLIAELVADAHRKAEVERLAREAEHRRWLKADRARKRAEAQKTSRDSLLAAIEHWGRVCQIEDFFREVEDRTRTLHGAHRTVVLDRLAQARTMIGETNALQRFLTWKTPDELCPPDDDSAD